MKTMHMKMIVLRLALMGLFTGCTGEVGPAQTLALLDGQPTVAFTPVVAFSQFTTDTMMPVEPGLEPGSYSWTVRALDDNDAVLAESNRVFFVKDALTLVAPAAGETVSAEPLLEWEAFPGAVTYQVILLDDDAYPPVVILDETTNETSFAVTSPLEPGSYSWAVWAFDQNGTLVAELISSFVVADE